MGWTWTRATKAQTIKNLLQKSNRGIYTVVVRKSEMDGDILWSIKDVQDATGKTVNSYIECAVLKPSDEGWGYNTIPEEMQPYYYGVPLVWLDEVPQPKNEPGSQQWRDAVRRLAGVQPAIDIPGLTMGSA